MKQDQFEKPQLDVDMEFIQEGLDYKLDTLDDYLQDEVTMCSPSEGFSQDSIMGLMTSLNMSFAI